MNYYSNGIWDIIKKFLTGWAVALVILAGISCIRYWDYILSVVVNNALTLFVAIAPVLLIAYVLFSLIRSVFR